MRYLVLLALALLLRVTLIAQSPSGYTPVAENLKARTAFQDDKYGLFIHWGVFSIPGDGEWVMNVRNIQVKEYSRLMKFFNPIAFDAKAWVTMAREAGMKYITFVTRHHDGFSLWDTKASDWKITNTPYAKDVLKMLADECKRQNIKLFLYYSLLDWTRDDYPRETGRTGQGTGRTRPGNYASYLQFMKEQLTELLTQYGDIAGIWFDGHWDQTAPEGAADRSSRLDWKYDEIYGLIHKLQPRCLVGNNHHLSPFAGEDFQMFERDLPHENRSGLNFQQVANDLPLETCETINGSWGFNMRDRSYKSVPDVIRLLVNAAGRNANLLLNVGPMPNGEIQPEFTDTLRAAGRWLQQYGASIYGTRGGLVPPQEWGVVTWRERQVYVHLLRPISTPYVFVPELRQKVLRASLLKDGKALRFRQQEEGVFVYINPAQVEGPDTVIRLETGEGK